ncbi:protein JINGUBANG-like [Silene latifolia]|uniref:protein JINGUBANG-like n=1 Tax=Silene latifolia TaxID=37657 RepID=UPI003D7812EF
MALDDSNTSSSSFSSFSFSSSSSISKQCSLESTNYNSDTNFKNVKIIIPCKSPHHYIRCITTLKTLNHHHITCMTVHKNLLYVAAGDKINVFDLTTLFLTNNHAFSSNGRDLSLGGGGFIKSILFYNHANVLTAHQDGKIRAWKRHRFVGTLPTLRDKVRRFVWGKNYVKVRRGKKKLWIEHYDVVSDLACNESNGVVYLYSVSWDKSLKIWRGSDFKCLETVTAHDDAINAVTVSVNGRVYTGSADGKIKVWDRASKSNNSNSINNNSNNNLVERHILVDVMEMHKSTGVNALALSRDGKVLLSGGCDGAIAVWEIDDVEDRMVEIGVLEGHYGPILCLIRLDYEGNNDVGNWDLFVSGSADRTVRIWGGWRGGFYHCLGVLEGHSQPVRSVAVARPPESGLDGVIWVCSGSLDGEIKIWQVMVGELVNCKCC